MVIISIQYRSVHFKHDHNVLSITVLYSIVHIVHNHKVLMKLVQ